MTIGLPCLGNGMRETQEREATKNTTKWQQPSKYITSLPTSNHGRAMGGQSCGVFGASIIQEDFAFGFAAMEHLIISDLLH